MNRIDNIHTVKSALLESGIACREFNWSDGRKLLYVQFGQGAPFHYVNEEKVEEMRQLIREEQKVDVSGGRVRDAAFLIAAEVAGS